MAEFLRKLNWTGISESAEVDDFTMITVSLGSEVQNNKMNVTVKNPPVNVFGDGTIQHKWVSDDKSCKFRAVKAQRGELINEELLELYAVHATTDPTIDVESNDYLIFSGVINKGKIKDAEKEHNIELECQDRNVIVLDRLIPPSPFKEADGWTSPKIIKELIRGAAENVGSMKVLSYSSTGTSTEYGPWLVDARLFSEGIVDSGTTTSASTGKLIDTGQNFTSTVSENDLVRNTTDETYAYVESVDDDENLTLSKDIMGSGDGYEISNGFIQDTRPDGTSFPDVSFAQIDKPVVEGVETLSSVDYTNTGTEVDNQMVCKRSARWFIDKQNRFHWYIPSDTPEIIMERGSTSAISPDNNYHKIIDANLENSPDDTINFIVFKAGYDMDGEIIRSYARAPFTGQPNVKDSKRDFMHIARNLKDEDVKEGYITKNSYDDYNYPTSYPMVPAWDSTGGTATNDSTYNSAFKVEAIKRARAKCQALFQAQSNPKWKGKIQLRGEFMRVGDLVQYTSKPHGISEILVRIKGVSHTFTPNSWTTEIQVEEDENEAERAIGG